MVFKFAAPVALFALASCSATNSPLRGSSTDPRGVADSVVDDAGPSRVYVDVGTEATSRGRKAGKEFELDLVGRAKVKARYCQSVGYECSAVGNTLRNSTLLA